MVKKRIALYFLLNIYTSYVCAQGMTAKSLSNDILTYLNLKDVRYYSTLENALAQFDSPINIEVIKIRNEINGDLMDFYYCININNYLISFYKVPLIDRYCLNSIKINISDDEYINSLLSNKSIVQYKNNRIFGKIIYSMENKILYEIEENWEYLTLSFENGILITLTFVFHTE